MTDAVALNAMELEDVNGGNVVDSLKTIAKANYEYWGVKDVADSMGELKNMVRKLGWKQTLRLVFG